MTVSAEIIPETLVPYIKILRKWKACNSVQLADMMERLPPLFEQHNVTNILTFIANAGAFPPKFRNQISVQLYESIHDVLPSENELGIRDTVYESRLVDNQDAFEEKKQKLPKTLLRIPTDIQFYIFNFLKIKDLISLQKVCRSICISARNPASVYKIKLNTFRQKQTTAFLATCYSQPKFLSVNTGNIGNDVRLQQYWNPKWYCHVRELEFWRSLDHWNSNSSVWPSEWETNPTKIFYFENLIKCKIDAASVLLSNVHIANCYGMKDLTLERISLTVSSIEHIRAFRHLETLSLNSVVGTGCTWRDLNPICLEKLIEFKFVSCDANCAGLIKRILIDSHPATVITNGRFKGSGDVGDFFSEQSMEMVEAVRSMRSFNADLYAWTGYDVDSLKSFLPLFSKAQHKDTQLFQTCNAYMYFDCDPQMHLQMVPPVSCLSAFCKSMQLNLDYSIMFNRYEGSQGTMKALVEMISNVPIGTFSDIKVKVILTSCIGENKDSRLIDAILLDLNTGNDTKILKDDVSLCLNHAESWFMPWLMFDEDRMRRIALRKLCLDFSVEILIDWDHWKERFDIYESEYDERTCNLVTQRLRGLDRILSTEKGSQWILERANQWKAIDSTCCIDIRQDIRDECVENKCSLNFSRYFK